MFQQVMIFLNLIDFNYLFLMGKQFEFNYSLFIMDYCMVFGIMLKWDGIDNNRLDWNLNLRFFNVQLSVLLIELFDIGDEIILVVLNDRFLFLKNILGLFFQGLVLVLMDGMIDINEWDVRYIDRLD